jgi:hypothetical protein
MQPDDYAGLALMRAELQRDYSPANAQERLLVNEVATCWQRLEKARDREELFFDLQKTSMAIRCGELPGAFQEEGGEVRMWLDAPHKAYDQVLRSIRDAGVAFDRAIRRIEQVRDKRLSRERAERKQLTKRPRPDYASTSETVIASHLTQAEPRPQGSGHKTKIFDN